MRIPRAIKEALPKPEWISVEPYTDSVVRVDLDRRYQFKWFPAEYCPISVTKNHHLVYYNMWCGRNEWDADVLFLELEQCRCEN